MRSYAIKVPHLEGQKVYLIHIPTNHITHSRATYIDCEQLFREEGVYLSEQLGPVNVEWIENS